MHRSHAARRTGAADDELRLQLSDLPRVEDNLEVDGFKPTLLSRLFDLVGLK